MNFCDPNKVHLRPFIKHEIDEETEAQLLEVSPTNWTPIVLVGTRVIDGTQRVLVAIKHNIPAIPFIRAK
jgi:hypothetical protein